MAGSMGAMCSLLECACTSSHRAGSRALAFLAVSIGAADNPVAVQMGVDIRYNGGNGWAFINLYALLVSWRL